MERKEAIEVIKKNWPDSSFTRLREALESLIPELAESEDEKIRKWLIHYFKEVCDNVSEKEKKGIVAWLEKQPKDSPVHSNSTNIGKVEQKQEWSEEEKAVLDALIRRFKGEDIYVSPNSAVKCLESLKERYTWKPSDEQMNALESAVSSLQSTALESLYQRLNKLT